MYEFISNFLHGQEHDGNQPAAIGETEIDTGEAGATASPAGDDLALRAALYGLVIQSCVDKVCLVIFCHTSNMFFY